ncbi:hypothetical protein [Halalkalicoccus jeotgali]|uniref:Uncharacterized protein n=1 Tax=Halalkalicoccus jeotgali (strain DSM 18796 / CECT 7217 / JCM 14584 / KCTC 4019 / B3) TaxID=795797 RepID=D8J9S2_HALJB|nr:hypothetical protein [Halalkalicoccus jeotgali]ADJ16411.1 hypothetical protein HacjB3_15160 [Halalkalicoccus jeotgali B3]ELY37145.1 hypothetical protein C497_10388 [Halalkalicoccus jeotgali B3]
MTDATDVRRFDLVRKEDESGVSGTGVVAVGVEFSNGYVELQWLNDDGNDVDAEENGHASYPGGVEDTIRVHGHDGRTEIRWLD